MLGTEEKKRTIRDLTSGMSAEPFESSLRLRLEGGDRIAMAPAARANLLEKSGGRMGQDLAPRSPSRWGGVGQKNCTAGPSQLGRKMLQHRHRRGSLRKKQTAFFMPKCENWPVSKRNKSAKNGTSQAAPMPQGLVP